MSDFLYDMAGTPIAFRRRWDDAYVFGLDGSWLGWCPWGDCEVVTPDGEPLGAIVGDRLVRRNDARGHTCDQHAEAPAPAAPHGTPGHPLPFEHRFAYSDIEPHRALVRTARAG
ncbi:MAG: hypothetical protein PGN07_06755 [Aeromicrobium erythreum]